MTGINNFEVPRRGGSKDNSLTKRQINMIQEAIDSVGEYGEVRLIVEKNRLRFVITQVSHDALKYQEGELLNKS